MKKIIKTSKNVLSLVALSFVATMCTPVQDNVLAVPSVITGNVTNITSTTAECTSNVTTDGGAAVTARGVCWSTTQIPTILNQKITNGTGTGTFTSNIRSLKPNTIYYVRAYATNIKGTVYGEQTLFKTSLEDEESTFTDLRDDNVYRIIAIGEQTWMKENLAYLPEVSPPVAGSETDVHYYVYDYDGTYVTAAKATSNYSIYGVLYNWKAALTACPEGWRLPSNNDWEELNNYLGTNAGGKMKESGTIFWNSPNTGATNESGFSALPGGCRLYINNTFSDIGRAVNYWSSDEYNTNNAWVRGMENSSANIHTFYGMKNNGFSIRCINGYSIPFVTTGGITNLTTTSADCYGHVTSDGGSAVFARGCCWSTSKDPTIDNFKTTNGAGTGSFTSNLTNLTPNTIYYVRAYATNSEGIAYGEVRRFTTQNTFTDDRDGNTYHYVRIGDQNWMAENLAYLPEVYPYNVSSSTEPYYYVYGYNGTHTTAAKATDNYSIYGVLYNYTAAMASDAGTSNNTSLIKGICPDGWHIPSTTEWTELKNYLIANGYNYDGTTEGNKIAKSMASANGWVGSTYVGAAGNTDYPEYRNKSGFTALPAGYMWSGYDFHGKGSYCYFWASKDDQYEFSHWGMSRHDTSLGSNSNDYKSYGFSVRCLKDN